MKKLCTLALGIGCMYLSVQAQINNEFHKSYRLSSTLWERGEGLQLLQNGRILEIGESSHCTGVTTCYNSCSLIWFNQEGTMIRNRKIGSSIGFYGLGAEECTDHSLIVHGNIANDALIMKTDSVGTVIWSKTIDHSLDMGGKDLVKIDTTCFVNGTLAYNASHISSFTQSGSFRWMKSPVSTAGDRYKINAMVKTGTNTIMGITEATNTSTYFGAAGLIEIDMNGNILNSKIISPSFLTYTRITAFNICRTSDGNFVATFAYTNSSYYVFKFDASMNILWATSITANPLLGSGYRDEIIADNAGGVWLGSHSQYSIQIELIHIGGNGALLEKNQYSNHDLIELTGLNYTEDCNLLVTGARRDGVTYSHFLAALGTDGKTSCLDTVYNVTAAPATLTAAPYAVTMSTETVNITTNTMFQETGAYQEINYCNTVADLCLINAIDKNIGSQLLVYPVPVHDELNIENTSAEQEVGYFLYNAMGEQILQVQLTGLHSTIDFTAYANGIYFYQIRVDNHVIKHGKLIKQ